MCWDRSYEPAGARTLVDYEPRVTDTEEASPVTLARQATELAGSYSTRARDKAVALALISIGRSMLANA